MARASVLIAGGGIGGMTLALTLNQIGVSCQVIESVPELKPLGVGINLQPNAVRELFDLGFSADDLNAIGVPAVEWALVGLNGNEIHSEPRGLGAGYRWPQYAVHRGELQMMLYRRVLKKLGNDAVLTGSRVIGYEKTDSGVIARVLTSEGETTLETDVLVGADGLHSALRAQMHPNQPPIQWGGAILWRGITRAKPIRTESSFVGLGTHRHRMVIYPISPTDSEGYATINWIAEQTVDNKAGWEGDWNRKVSLEHFAHHFENWAWDWLDVPALLRGASEIFEYPMIDRDPIDTWVDGPVVLIGDAAHVMYPTGSNGASQAIVDARVLGACMLEHGVNTSALSAFDDKLCGPVSELVLRNRGSGPFGLLNLVDERCGGLFDSIDDVIPLEEREAFLANYRAAAGFAVEKLNNSPPTIHADSVIA